MTNHKTVTREEWLAARLELLKADEVTDEFLCFASTLPEQNTA